VIAAQVAGAPLTDCAQYGQLPLHPSLLVGSHVGIEAEEDVVEEDVVEEDVVNEDVAEDNVVEDDVVDKVVGEDEVEDETEDVVEAGVVVAVVVGVVVVMVFVEVDEVDEVDVVGAEVVVVTELVELEDFAIDVVEELLVVSCCMMDVEVLAAGLVVVFQRLVHVVVMLGRMELLDQLVDSEVNSGNLEIGKTVEKP